MHFKYTIFKYETSTTRISQKKDNCNFNLTKDNELDINSTCLTISSLCNSGYH